MLHWTEKILFYCNKKEMCGWFSFILQDLSKLNRDPRKIIYLSAHAQENSLQPENGAVIKPFKLETDDTALLDFIPFLECEYRCLPLDRLNKVVFLLFQIVIFVYNRWSIIWWIFGRLFGLYAVVARNPPADIRQVLASYEGRDIPEEFIRRSKEHRR